jgi:hypothetical protein
MKVPIVDDSSATLIDCTPLAYTPLSFIHANTLLGCNGCEFHTGDDFFPPQIADKRAAEFCND